MIVIRHKYISARQKESHGKGKPARLAAVGRALAHLKYIQHRPGEDRDPKGRELFSEEGETPDPKALRKAIKELGAGKVVVHKITLAPEIEPADKKAFTREVMDQIAKEKGLDLIWGAVEHGNTEHSHVHVVVLGKDKQGKDVLIDKKDYSKMKEYGDRYLERAHPLEMDRARQERERKEKERLEARQKEQELARAERIRDGLELPWMHRKIIREMHEPYDQWKKQQAEKEIEKKTALKKEKDLPMEESEKPYFQDTIEVAGKDWSRDNKLSELNDLNVYLWDNPRERISKNEYRKLMDWIREKEGIAPPPSKEISEPNKRQKGEPKKATTEESSAEEERDHFEYKGQKYDKDTDYEKLTALSQKLRENKKERLPINDYQKLRGFIENKDRERWSNVVAKQLEIAKTQDWQQKARDGSPDNYRYIDPVQESLMANPVIGLYLKGASAINQLVKLIPLDDRHRDINKEVRDGLLEKRGDVIDDALKKGETGSGGEAQDEVNKIDKALDDNLDQKNEEKRKKKEKPREDPFKYDPWGER